MLLLCVATYLVIVLPILILIWASLVVAKWDDQERGYDVLEDRLSSFE
jgi:phosphate starvation-inducible membrane PsiE